MKFIYKNISTISITILLMHPIPTPAAEAKYKDFIIHGSDYCDIAALNAGKTLQLVLKKSRELGIESITLSGIFLINESLVINNAKQLKIDGQELTTFIAASPSVDNAISAKNSDNLHIGGLNIYGFKDNGIFIKDSQGVTIEKTSIKNTRSFLWSQGAIHLTGNIKKSKIINNYIEGADYAGIVVDTTKDSDITSTKITGNFVINSCRKIKDCGAIYINDRGRRSRGMLIRKNTIIDFGDYDIGGRGIYIDDWASNVTVISNIISGKGRFAFQIHGGKNNMIAHNRIYMNDINQFLLYESAIDGFRSDMTNNIIQENSIILSDSSRKSVIPITYRTGPGSIKAYRNKLCILMKCSSLK